MVNQSWLWLQIFPRFALLEKENFAWNATFYWSTLSFLINMASLLSFLVGVLLILSILHDSQSDTVIGSTLLNHGTFDKVICFL